VLLAVTLDPARDTQQALQQFSATHGLADNPNWFALRGDPAALTPVWRDYAIFPGMSATSEGPGTPTVGGGMGHTDAIYLIDPQGRERVFLRSSATPQEIASDLEALLN
jgi:protein SCO1/2